MNLEVKTYQHKYESVFADHVHSYMPFVLPQDDGNCPQNSAKYPTAHYKRVQFEERQDKVTLLPSAENFPNINLIENMPEKLIWDASTMDPSFHMLASLAMALELT